MRSFITLLFLALVPACTAFLPATPATARSRDVSMMAKNDFAKQTAKIAAAITPAIISAPVWATEGTGEAFGIDDSRIPLVSFTIFVSLAALFNTWGKTQDEEDFLDVYKRD